MNNIHTCANVVAVEGLNGVGKSTLVERYRKAHPEVSVGYCVPEEYRRDKELMKALLFEAPPMTGALYYLAANADARVRLDKAGDSRVLIDRSVWSTLAQAYSRDAGSLKSLWTIVRILQDKLVIPQTVVVLRASFETCRARIGTKSTGTEFDRDSEAVFARKYELYGKVRAAGFDVRFIDTDGKTADEVYTEFEKMDPWRTAMPTRCGLTADGMALDRILDAVSRVTNLSRERIEGKEKGRECVTARVLAADLAIDTGIATKAELAERFDCSLTAVYDRLAAAQELESDKEYAEWREKALSIINGTDGDADKKGVGGIIKAIMALSDMPFKLIIENRA